MTLTIGFAVAAEHVREKQLNGPDVGARLE
jgi:hypothetical protein